jgi:hypothetical protein
MKMANARRLVAQANMACEKPKVDAFKAKKHHAAPSCPSPLIHDVVTLPVVDIFVVEQQVVSCVEPS